MPTRSQVILALCIAAVLLSVGLSFFRTYIKGDFVVVELADTENPGDDTLDTSALPN
jgi:hypothetical protein